MGKSQSVTGGQETKSNTENHLNEIYHNRRKSDIAILFLIQFLLFTDKRNLCYSFRNAPACNKLTFFKCADFLSTFCKWYMLAVHSELMTIVTI